MTSAVLNEVGIERASAGIRLQCPRCRFDLHDTQCVQCGLQLQVRDGIVHALPPERMAYYERFTEDYQRIRAAEGRGSEGDEFYLGLPYKDASGRNSGQWRIRARSYDYLMKKILRPALQHGLQTLLDLGAGNCWMSFRLSRAGFTPAAVDLLTNVHDGLGAGEHYRNHVSCMFPRFQAELTRLPFQNDQFDAAIFNASFHYAEDYEAALREALRCVRKGGMVIVSDTPWYSRDESGRKMVSERRAAFLRKYGAASNSLESLEYVTDERMRDLEEKLSIRWTIYSPYYGWRWSVRPIVAKLRRKREPARFRIYAAQKALA